MRRLGRQRWGSVRSGSVRLGGLRNGMTRCGMGYLIVPTYDCPEKELWMGSRGLGSGSAWTILSNDRNRFESQYDLWRYITKRAEKPPPNAAMLRGISMEPKIRQMWEASYTMERWYGEPVQLIHADYPWMRAQIDWATYEMDVICDMKSTNNRTIDALNAGEMPPWYAAQLAHQMAVSGARVAYICAYDGKRLGIGKLPRHDRECELLIKKEREWWERYVLTDTPPPQKRVKVVLDGTPG